MKKQFSGNFRLKLFRYTSLFSCFYKLDSDKYTYIRKLRIKEVSTGMLI